MKRRDFLKLSLGGLATAAIPVVLRRKTAGSPRTEARAFGRRFRGTSKGCVLISADKGDTWDVAADFGDQCPVLDLAARGDALFVTLGFRQFGFTLKSTDGQTWRSVEL